MITMRYHLLSMTVAVVALVLGLVLGASTMSGRLIDMLSSDRNDLTAQVGTLRGEKESAAARAGAVERFVDANGSATVRGALQGRSVAVLTLDGADPADVDRVSGLVEEAGATVTGRLAMKRAMTAAERGETLRGLVPRLLPAGATLPTTTDTGQLAGALIGSLVAQRPGALSPRSEPEVVAALRGLADAGFVEPTPPVAPAPAQLVLVVAGTGEEPQAGRTAAALAGAVDPRAAGTVLAGRSGSTAVDAARTDPAARTAVSTVDGLELPSSRVATVLALREQAEGRAAPHGPAADTVGRP